MRLIITATLNIFRSFLYNRSFTAMYVSKEPQRQRWFQKNNSALFFLVLLGCGILFFSIVLVACSFVVNYGDDYEVSGYGGIEEKVQSEFHYTQYWAGIPFIVTGVLVILSGTFQSNRGLTITTSIFCVFTIALTFFVISLDGTNWRNWNAEQGKNDYWNRKSGVECTTVNTDCVCKDSTTPYHTSPMYKCSVISQLSSLYGAIVGSAICVTLFAIFALMIITKSLSWKRLRRYRSKHYDNGYPMDDMDRGRRPPSFVDLPYAKRDYDDPRAHYGDPRGEYGDRRQEPLPMPPFNKPSMDRVKYPY